MGFLDKAKKMAEQAQSKLDEVQQQFNESQGGGGPAPGGPAVEYDKHGRPIPQAPPGTSTPPHGDPLPGDEAPGATPDPDAPVPDSSAPPAPAPAAPPAPAPVAPPAPAPVAPPAPAPAATTPSEGAPEDRNHPSYAPPKLTSGDPLSG